MSQLSARETNLTECDARVDVGHDVLIPDTCHGCWNEKPHFLILDESDVIEPIAFDPLFCDEKDSPIPDEHQFDKQVVSLWIGKPNCP